MYESRIKHLQEAHRALDKQINQVLASGVFEDSAIQEMKKQKLKYKDAIRDLIRQQSDHVHLDK
tara:strand:- start:70 stop:261 length:192 start_codon:yes stop_codon:yes gene_type:complete